MQNAPLKGGHHGKSNHPALGRTGGRPPDGGAGGSRHLLPGIIPADGGPVAALRCGPSEPAAAGLRRGRAGYPPAAILPAADGGAGSAAGRGSGAGIRPGGLASRMGRRVSRTGTAGGRSVPPGRAAAVSGPTLPGGRPLPADETVLSGQCPDPPGPGVGHFCTGGPGDIKNLHLRYHIL